MKFTFNQVVNKLSQDLLLHHNTICIFGEDDSMNFNASKKLESAFAFDQKITLSESELLDNFDEFTSNAFSADFFYNRKIIKINYVTDKSLKILTTISEKLSQNKDRLLIINFDCKVTERSKIYNLCIDSKIIAVVTTPKIDSLYFKSEIEQAFSEEKWFNRIILDYFMERIPRDLFSLTNEIERVRLFTKSKAIDSIDINFFSNIFEDFREQSIFNLIDKFCNKDKQGSLRIFQDLVNSGEFTLVGSLHLLFAHFYDLLIFKKDSSCIKQPYQLMKFRQYEGKWQASSILKVIDEIKRIEKLNLTAGERLATVHFEYILSC